ncbi:MAG: NAD(P)/FAD-dependent oxidoreductase [Chloroflexota bacterium]|nr:NAD(P)/FAD-dependent oxidoreductase [Chloroflexota bacterium]
MTRNAVLGGGALGLTVALRLAQRGEEVVLFEREPIPGGLAAGFPLGPSYLEKFYHHLFRSDREATALIDELGLSSKLVWPVPVTSTLIDGKMLELDSPWSLLRFAALPLLDRIRLGAAVAYLKLEPNYHRLEQMTADAWLRKWMGPRVYQVLWEPLLRSKFGDRYREIAMPWFWARMHYRSQSLGYLRGGFQQLYDALVAEIRRLGGEARFGTAVIGVTPVADGFRVAFSGGEEVVHRVVSTLPTQLSTQLIPALAGSFAERYGSVDSYGAHCAVLTLDRQLTDVYWLNVNDSGYPFLALVEHTNYMPPEDYGGRHIVYLGNYLPMNDPLYTERDEQVLERYYCALRKINPTFDPSWVTEYRIFKAPYAQPIVTVGYPDRVPPHTTPIANLYLANMSQVYPQDRGQNYSIAMANRLVDEILQGRPSA